MRTTGLTALLLILGVVFGISCAVNQGTNVPGDSPRATSLGHASEQILIDRLGKKEVVALLGPPEEIRKDKFKTLVYGVPADKPIFDEQWVYSNAQRLERTLVFFHHGSVVLAVREWSDY